MTRTFLTSKTESRIDNTCTAKFNHRPLESQSQVYSDQNIVCSGISHLNKFALYKSYVYIVESEKPC